MQEIKKASPSLAYQALMRLEKTVGEQPLLQTWQAISLWPSALSCPAFDSSV